MARCSSLAARTRLWQTESRPQRARLLRRRVSSWPPSLCEVSFTPLHGWCSWGEIAFPPYLGDTLAKMQSICQGAGALCVSHGRAHPHGKDLTVEPLALSG